MITRADFLGKMRVLGTKICKYLGLKSYNFGQNKAKNAKKKKKKKRVSIGLKRRS